MYHSKKRERNDSKKENKCPQSTKKLFNIYDSIAIHTTIQALRMDFLFFVQAVNYEIL